MVADGFGTKKLVFCDYLEIYYSDFKYLFFYFKEDIESYKTKKIHRNPITGSHVNAFNCFLKFPQILYSYFLSFLGESRIKINK